MHNHRPEDSNIQLHKKIRPYILKEGTVPLSQAKPWINIGGVEVQLSSFNVQNCGLLQAPAALHPGKEAWYSLNSLPTVRKMQKEICFSLQEL